MTLAKIPPNDAAGEGLKRTLGGSPGESPEESTGELEKVDEVLDAELVTEEDYTLQRSARALTGYRVVSAYRGVKTVVRHDHTKTVVRHMIGYPLAGIGVAVRRWRDTHGASRYERQMRAAEAAGDQEALRYWQEADTSEKHRRHQRIMDWVTSPVQLVKAGAIGTASLAGLLLALGIVLAIHQGDVSMVLAPISAVLDAIAFTWWFLTAYGALMLLGGTALGIAWLYQQGRMHAEMPQWLSQPAADGNMMDGLPDENTILNALKNLNIPGFNKAIKEGWRIKFLLPPVLDGKGFRTQLALPPACPVVEIVKRKTVLAHNLVRYPIEVWPTEPQPSVLDLWVANPGALSGPVDPWPLLADLDNAMVDYFQGVPVGVTIKGDVVRGKLSEANYAFGGIMGSGKSTTAINLVLGAMLDPLVDIDVVVMAENADFEPMKPRLRSIRTGAGDDTVDASMELLRSLYEELSVRGHALREHDERAVTRQLAELDDRLRPRVVVIDECQNLFLSKHGKAALEVATKLMSTARKYAITLIWLTPEPSKDALPRKLITISSNKACFAIGDQLGNDAVLGTGSYKAGISAVGLTPKTDEGDGDVGTCMQRGFTAKPGLLRSFYVTQEDAHRVTKRSMRLREQHNITGGQQEERDVLADTLAVMGATSGRAGEIIKAMAAKWQYYQGWKIQDLIDVLADFGVKVPTTGRLYPVDPDTVRNIMAQRDAELDEYE